MAIDPTKVLVIYNTSTANGKTQANLYAALRGLGASSSTYHALGFPFGAVASYNWQTNSPALLCAKSQRTSGAQDEGAYVGLAISAAITAFCFDHKIQAILVDPTVPRINSSTADTLTQGGPLEAYICTYLRLPVPGSVRASANSAAAFGNLLYSYLKNPSGQVPWQTAVPRYQPTALGHTTPYGRIGWYGCTDADITRTVQDALFMETQDNRKKMHIVGGVIYTGNSLSPTNISAHHLFREAGFTDLWHFNQSAANPTFPEYNQRTKSWTNFTTGSGLEPISPFGFLISSELGNTAAQFTGGGSVHSNYSIVRGAWGFWWTSNAGYYGGMLNTKVGSDGSRFTAAIITTAEPLTSGVVPINSVAIDLLYGGCMAQANYGGDRSTVIGDPLYAPYKATALPFAHQYINTY